MPALTSPVLEPSGSRSLRRTVLAAYDRLFGLELEHLVVDGCITKALCRGQVTGPARWTAANGG